MTCCLHSLDVVRLMTYALVRSWKLELRYCDVMSGETMMNSEYCRIQSKISTICG